MLVFMDIWSDFPTVTAQQKGVTKRGHFYTKPEVRAAEEWFRYKFSSKFGKRDGFPDKDKAYRVCISYHYHNSKKKLWGKYKTTRPDLDNQTKIILDAITHSHLLWWDDSQVSSLILDKQYAETSYIQIAIYELE